MKILVTGATGNVGTEVIRQLSAEACQVVAAVRDPENLGPFPSEVSLRRFDFLDIGTFPSALEDINILFLVRPPQLSRVNEIFKPLLEHAQNCGIEKIVFLSVQGVATSRFIPHNKIERLIRSMGFQYIFIRPGYFMQNLTTTLLPEIKRDRSVTLPAGNAKFNWIDVQNIGEAAAIFLTSFGKYKNKAYDLTGQENRSFEEVVEMIREITGVHISYRNLDPVRFYLKKKNEGMPQGFIMVMIFLHFLPRFQKEPARSDIYRKLTGKDPGTLREFIEREQLKFH